jgi:ABC-type ATPase involved in cell division
MQIVVQSPVVASPRVLQVRGIFDLPSDERSEVKWDVEMPLGERPWNVGLIVGPSGCGKTTIARRLWPEEMGAEAQWPVDRSILDAFPENMPIKDVVGLLSSVGFSSPPAWLRPYHVLSTGQQFRARLARLLAECPGLAVMDEFTSVVDRTVAQIGSHALAKTVRARKQRFVAVTCHEDVEAWLNPDWVYQPAAGTFAWRFLQRRPAIELEIGRVGPEAWRLFKPHHYLSGNLAPTAVALGAFWNERIVAFSAWLPAFTRRGGRREHRTVVLPDYQGAGIGHALSSYIASLWKALGIRACSTTTHPAFVAARLRSGDWRMIRKPSLANGRSKVRHALTRLTAGFEYVGKAGDISVARRLLQEMRC